MSGIEGAAVRQGITRTGWVFAVAAVVAAWQPAFAQQNIEEGAAAMEPAPMETEQQSAPAETIPVREAEPSASVDDVTALDDIVVTANKRAELLTKVPAALSVMTRDQLEKIGAINFQDFASYLPGVSSSNRGTGINQIIVRGVTPGPGTLSTTTALYIDEIPIGSSTPFALGSAALDFNAFDLERLELLSGPQGTLYGANSLGGLLKYVTTEASAGLRSQLIDSELSTTADGGLNHALRGAINAPFANDRFGLRVAAYSVKDAGFIDNTERSADNINNSSTLGGRAKLSTMLGPDVTVRLSAVGQKIDRESMNHVDRDPRTSQPPPGQDELDDTSYVPEPFVSDFQLYSGVVTWDTAWGTLTSATGWQRLETDFHIDTTRIFGGVAQTRDTVLFPAYSLAQTRKWTQELRFASLTAESWEWMLGGYYTTENSFSVTFLGAEQNPKYSVDGTPDPFLVAVGAAPVFYGELPTKFQEISLFGNMTYFATDWFDVALGLRQSKNEQDFVQRFTGLLGNPQNPTAVSEGHSTSGENVTNYSVSPRFHLGEKTLLYGRAANGYRPGGPNFVTRDAAGRPSGPETFKSDTLWNYEIGLKTYVLGSRASIDFNVYQLDWKDMQIVVSRSGINSMENAGNAEIRGAELRSSWALADWLTLHGSTAYNDARLADDSPLLGARTGQRLPLSPRFSGSIISDARLPVPFWEGHTFNAALNYRYVGPRNAGYDGSTLKPQYHLPAYDLWDAHLRVDVQAYTVGVNLKNVLNDVGQISADPTTLQYNANGPVRASPTQPRTILLTVSAEFF